MSILIALAGNQNCGKTTLFNQLTGSSQHVGNFPGVTVEHKEGRIKGEKDMSVVDLPGIYSLSPYTPEEIVSRDFIIKQNPDAILNIVDATNLQRNLYLTLQLIELGHPMVIALNMMDEVRASGITIDIKKLSEELGVPVVPISAAKNQGVEELVEELRRVIKAHQLPKRTDFCEGEVHKALHAAKHLIEDHAAAAGYPARFAASKLIEGDAPLEEALELDESDKDILQHIIDQMEEGAGTDREAALADMRYQFIEQLYDDCVSQKSGTREMQRSVKIDRILTHKIWAIPIFIGIMGFIFYLTFGPIGGFLSGAFEEGIAFVTNAADTALTGAGVSLWMHSFVIDGVFTGVGTVLSFLPVILILFFFLSILEDSGYMARVAFVMDSSLRKIGLSGRSFVPMLIGFGCSVPAIMSARTLASERDRKLTILITPFMSCGAKVPIYALFTAAFFSQNQALVMISLYLLGIAVAILTGLLFKKTLFKGNPVPFVLELPAYRLPSPKSVLLHMWEKAKDFLVRAFTIIFLASIVIWFLQSFDFQFNFVTDNSQSILAGIGQAIAPVFAPLGFGNWQASTALITGLTAKETVISTLSVLTGGEQMLTTLFTPLSAYSFLSFVLLYMPCIAAVATTKRELGGKNAVLTIIYQTLAAWVVAFIIFQVGSLFLGG
ncbi:ferrous iron transport protein B [Christensenella tenuis]|jgi:ferrous iron transport protein B|uniref:Ferrous iron transport protein B n=1 Tax=Christensenella tenuis TaxID=2763033 RepID=A0ABR7EGP9_9FIRM|nr:ferrous iron transport protein B [Christensenella tenuis]MBC5648926.1 ferrous iron transport protein B [Christensenella tenuis]